MGGYQTLDFLDADHDKIAAHLYQGSESSSQPSRHMVLSQLPPVPTTEAEPQRLKGRESTVSVLNVAIEALNLAKELSNITPAGAVFGSVSVILTMIKVSLLFFVDQLQTEMHLGRNDKPNGLC